MKKLITLLLLVFTFSVSAQNFNTLSVLDAPHYESLALSSKIVVWDSINQGQIKHVTLQEMSDLLSLSGFDLSANYNPTGDWVFNGAFTLSEGTHDVSFITSGITAPRAIVVPDSGGQLALTSDISAGFDETGSYAPSGEWDFTNNVTVAGLFTADGGIEMSGNDLTGIPDPVNPLDAVNLQYFNANIPSNSIQPVVVTDSTYTFLEADLLESKTHLFNVVADTIEVTIPDVTLPANEQIFATVKALNDNPIKIIPSDSANQVQYIIKDVDEAVAISSYIENQWFKWRNVTSSAYGLPPAPSTINYNTTFNDATNLTLEAAWAVAGGVAHYDRSSNHDLIFNLSEAISTGDEIQITFTTSNSTNAGSRIGFYAGSGTNGETILSLTIYADGTYVITHTLTSTTSETTLTLLGTNNASGGEFDIDNVEIVKL